ncbi:MAG: TolB-like 6-bladed beta-propeller domain-containing protein [Bacteroides sp.]|nr:TolB-like 6-bladed beta-propeller domain-containing protein [Bacteroides sp.]
MMVRKTKEKSILLMLLFVCILGACKNEKKHSVLSLFSEEQLLSQKESNIHEDSLAMIEGLICDEENLIAYDLHSGDSYTLFDIKTGSYITRFGTIGQGPDEIPSGCYGYLLKKNFSVFNDQMRIVMKYSLDSLRNNSMAKNPVCLAKYDISDAQISRLIAIDNNTFFCAGTYKSQYQYLLFDKNSKILDYGINVYNASDSTFNMYTRFLANQGDLVMQPGKSVFAYSVNFSSNLDIIEVVDGKIKLIKSLRLADPICKPASNGVYQSVGMTENSQVGYINLSATSKYIYALYSDKKIYEHGRKSNVVLAYDWNGNAVKKYILNADAYYIAIDAVDQTIYAAVKNAEGG